MAINQAQLNQLLQQKHDAWVRAGTPTPDAIMRVGPQRMAQFRITPQEWAQLGGDANSYAQTYQQMYGDSVGAQELSANYPAPQPRPQQNQGQSYPTQNSRLNHQQLNQIAQQKAAAWQAAGSPDPSTLTPQQLQQFRLTPDDYSAAGGDVRDYAQQYQQWYGDNLGLSNTYAQPTQPNPGATDPQGNPVFNMDTAAGAIGFQQEENLWNVDQQQRWNRPEQQTEYGSTDWVMGPNGEMIRREQLSPEEQALLEQRRGRDESLGGIAQDRLNQAARQGEFSYGGLTPGREAPTDFSALPQLSGINDMAGERSRIEGDIYGSWERNMEDQFGREEEQLRQSLLDRGIPLESEQAGYAINQMRDAHNEARLDARARATEIGGQEMSRRSGIELGQRGQLQGEEVSLFDLSDRARNRATTEYRDQRGAPMSEAASAISNIYGVTNPEFTGIRDINVPEIDVGNIAGRFADIGLGYYNTDTTDAFNRYQAGLTDAYNRWEWGQARPNLANIEGQWNLAAAELAPNLLALLAQGESGGGYNEGGGGGGGGGGGTGGTPNQTYIDFNNADTNHDGTLSAEEQAASGWGNRPNSSGGGDAGDTNRITNRMVQPGTTKQNIGMGYQQPQYTQPTYSTRRRISSPQLTSAKGGY